MIACHPMEPTASEAIYAFAAWLTTRDESITISAKHDAGSVASLVDQFVKHNKWAEPGKNYPDNFSHPPE